MIAKGVKLIVLLALAGILAAFAVANRHEVIINFDPIDTANPAFALGVPVFALAFAMLLTGIILGWIIAWFGAGKLRRAARTKGAEAARWKSEAQKLAPEQPSDRANALSLPLPKPSKAA